MSNLTDALIAAKLVGGSGGSGGGSGLPEITPGSETVIYDKTLSFNAMGPGVYAASMSEVSITDQNYMVSFDSVDYHPTYKSVSSGFVLGNPAIIRQGADTGEPFAISNLMGGATACFTPQSGSHAVKIAQGEPQSPPDGSVLMVQGGAWAAAEIKEGAFYITPTYSGSTITAIDRTFAEIVSAIDSGAFPILWAEYNGHRIGTPYYVADFDAESSVIFRTIQPSISPVWIKIEDDGSISQGNDD